MGDDVDGADLIHLDLYLVVRAHNNYRVGDLVYGVRGSSTRLSELTRLGFVRPAWSEEVRIEVPEELKPQPKRRRKRGVTVRAERPGDEDLRP